MKITGPFGRVCCAGESNGSIDAFRFDYHRQRSGRRHSFPPPGSFRQADLAAGARRLPAARETTGIRPLFSLTPNTGPKKRGPTRTAKPFIPASNTASAAIRRSTAPPCCACVRRTSVSFATATAFRLPGRSAMRTSNLTTPRLSTFITFTESTGSTRLSRSQAHRIAIHPLATSLAFSSCMMI